MFTDSSPIIPGEWQNAQQQSIDIIIIYQESLEWYTVSVDVASIAARATTAAKPNAEILQCLFSMTRMARIEMFAR